tara:strand:+ start:313 stop:840 length:528 start_codon:yes stop_codon:yes gene_type:complete
MVFNTNILAGSSGQGEDALTVTKVRARHENGGAGSFCQIWTFDGVSSPDTLLQTSTTVSAGVGNVEYTFSTDPVVTGQSKIWIVLRGTADVNMKRSNSTSGQMIGGGYNSSNGDATNIVLGSNGGIINPVSNLDLSDGRTSIGQSLGVSGVAIGVGKNGSGTDRFPAMGGLVSIA